jgi:hypothetical protein
MASLVAYRQNSQTVTLASQNLITIKKERRIREKFLTSGEDRFIDFGNLLVVFLRKAGSEYDRTKGGTSLNSIQVFEKARMT